MEKKYRGLAFKDLKSNEEDQSLNVKNTDLKDVMRKVKSFSEGLGEGSCLAL